MNKPIFNSLQFDNIDSLNHGIYITGESVYDSPERDVEAIEIAGRSGDYLLDKGRWKNIEVTYHCGCFGDDQNDFANKIRNFRNQLASKRGYKRIVDSYNPAEYRMGTFTNPVEVDTVSMKRAGEFDVVFNCKPQRYLMSGEAEQTITNGQTLFNPTPFEASPLLVAEGYGTIGFNGYSINIANETFGDIELLKANTKTGYSIDESYTYSADMYNTNDTATIDFLRFRCDVKLSQPVRSASASISSYTGTQPHAFAEPTPSSGSYTLRTDIIYDSLSWTVGSGLASSTAIVNVTVTHMDNTTETVRLTVSFNVTEQNGNGNFHASASAVASGTLSVAVTRNAIIAHSTKSALGTPTYIDCELGEAYMIKNGEAISLNRYIDLGSDLPTLASGNNTITFSNTITSLKIIPKWWVL